MTECEVLLNGNDCEAPPESSLSIRTRCYACGQPACKACSQVVSYRGRNRRVCRDCIEMLTRHGELATE